MSFVLSSTDSSQAFWHWVKIPVPVDGGYDDTHRIRVRYQVINHDEVQHLADTEPDSDLLERAIVDWEGVNDEHGAPIPFSAEALRRLLNIPYAKAALWLHYVKAQAGGARRGN